MKSLKQIFAGLSVVVLFGMISLSAQEAHAVVFMNFDSPEFSSDAASGDAPHEYLSSSGYIHFNGRITNELNSVETPDNTTGSTSFWKNTSELDVLTMTFDFDVNSFSLYTRMISGQFTVQGEVYDINNVLVDSGSFDAVSGAWTFNDTDIFAQPIRKLVIFSSNGNGGNIAFDDLTLNPVSTSAVPEPISLLLLGSGLVGAIGFNRRKK